MALPARFAKKWVACNVYITAGGRQTHPQMLSDLCDSVQEHCRSLRKPQSPAALAHAYCDRVYNRSSFHLAGSAENVALVTKGLVEDALNALEKENPTASSIEGGITEHPNVGYVDHIAVMPLNEPDHIVPSNEPITASGAVAHSIGDIMQARGIHVVYYGSANKAGTPLARVRKEFTHFFRSGSLTNETGRNEHKQYAIIGAPSEFVENFNVRVKCDKKTAQTLTRRVRERDGGLTGVEALTLPYGESFEIACNLLKPKESTVEDILRLAKEMEGEQDSGLVIELGYRVGTTARQCLETLAFGTDAENQQHDGLVKKRFLAAIL